MVRALMALVLGRSEETGLRIEQASVEGIGPCEESARQGKRHTQRKHHTRASVLVSWDDGLPWTPQRYGCCKPMTQVGLRRRLNDRIERSSRISTRLAATNTTMNNAKFTSVRGYPILPTLKNG